FLPLAELCRHHLLIERMAKLITHRQGPIWPLGHLCVLNELPMAGELLTSTLDGSQLLTAPRRDLPRREDQPADARHFEELLVFGTQYLKLFGDQLPQILGHHLVERCEVPLHHPAVAVPVQHAPLAKGIDTSGEKEWIAVGPLVQPESQLVRSRTVGEPLMNILSDFVRIQQL